MLRVAVISHLYPSAAAPQTGRFIHHHVRSLRDAGIDARVIAPVPWVPPGLARTRPRWRAYADTALESTELDGVPVQRLPYFTPPRPLHVVGAWSLATALARAWNQLHPDFDCDLVHAHTLTPDGLAACLLARRLARPVVCSARGSDLHTDPVESRLVRWMTRRTLRACDALVTVSAALAQDARRLEPRTSPPHVIYNGVADCFRSDLDRAAARRRLGLDPHRWTVVFVGRCELDKGARELIEGFASAHLLDSDLLVLGEGSARAELEHLARAWGVAASVHFRGRVDHAEVALHLRAADVFVLPSHAEGMPNALLEAMAAGLPCIATPVGGVPEILEPGVNGLLVPLRSRAAIASSLLWLHQDPRFAQALGAAAAVTIRNRLSWETNAQEHLRLYQELTSRTPSHDPSRASRADRRPRVPA